MTRPTRCLVVGLVIAMPEAQVEIKRPSGSECICGHWHGFSDVSGWFKNWCGNQCCWNEETCRKCGRVYGAVSGVLLRGPRVAASS